MISSSSSPCALWHEERVLTFWSVKMQQRGRGTVSCLLAGRSLWGRAWAGCRRPLWATSGASDTERTGRPGCRGKSPWWSTKAGRFRLWKLNKHNLFQMQFFKFPFRCDSEAEHSPETTEHAGYHHIQDYKLVAFHLLLWESEASFCQGLKTMGTHQKQNVVLTPDSRIHEGSAAATQCAAHQLGASQDFETEPLQEGLTGNITLTSLDAQSSKHTHIRREAAFRYYAPRIWNKLPENRISAPNLTSFKPFCLPLPFI